MRSVHLLFICLLLSATTIAQEKCGTEVLAKKLAAQDPTFQQHLNEVKQGVKNNTKTLQKATQLHAIPVVFHIVLNTNQQLLLGGADGIKQRIISQLEVLNQDFNAENGDRDQIPGDFLPLFGDAGVHFALARQAPDGSPTDGFHIITTNQLGFLSEGGTGSGFGFSNAKYSTTGGVNAWDPTSYLNIWVINPIIATGNNSVLLGLAIPYFFVENNSAPRTEMGVILHYQAFGKRNGLGDRYIKGADLGRTLTHEVGHMFNLFHVWGDDDGKCPFNGGDDDGVADTPPQGYPTSGCPSTYPVVDGCTKTSPGIMYMNFMDYTDDRCVYMFSKGQVERVQQTLQPGEAMFSLTQHPDLLVPPPIGQGTVTNKVTIYPNPADDVVNILYERKTSDVKGMYVVDLLGQVVASQEVTEQSSYYHFNLSGVQTGFYILVIDRGSDKEVIKLMVQ